MMQYGSKQLSITEENIHSPAEIRTVFIEDDVMAKIVAIDVDIQTIYVELGSSITIEVQCRDMDFQEFQDIFSQLTRSEQTKIINILLYNKTASDTVADDEYTEFKDTIHRELTNISGVDHVDQDPHTVLNDIFRTTNFDHKNKLKEECIESFCTTVANGAVDLSAVQFSKQNIDIVGLRSDDTAIETFEIATMNEIVTDITIDEHDESVDVINDRGSRTETDTKLEPYSDVANGNLDQIPETESNSDEDVVHGIEVIQEANVEEDLDLETRMFRLQQSDNDTRRHIGRVLNYHEVGDQVELSIRLPDESLGRIAYDVPESVGDWFVEVVDVAITSDKKHDVGLANLSSLEGAHIPIREVAAHNCGEYEWTIDVDRGFDSSDLIETEDVVSSESTDSSIDDEPRTYRAQIAETAANALFATVEGVAKLASILLALPMFVLLVVFVDSNEFREIVTQAYLRKKIETIFMGGAIWGVILLILYVFV